MADFSVDISKNRTYNWHQFRKSRINITENNCKGASLLRWMRPCFYLYGNWSRAGLPRAQLKKRRKCKARHSLRRTEAAGCHRQGTGDAAKSAPLWRTNLRTRSGAGRRGFKRHEGAGKIGNDDGHCHPWDGLCPWCFWPGALYGRRLCGWGRKARADLYRPAA